MSSQPGPSQPPASLQDLHALRTTNKAEIPTKRPSDALILANSVVWLWTTSLNVIDVQWTDTYAALLQYLRRMSFSQPTTGLEYKEPSWIPLQKFLFHCVELVDDLLESSESAYPLSVPFNDSNIPRESSQPIADQFLLVVKSVEDLPHILTFFLKLVVDVISQNLLCEWFLSSIVNRLSATGNKIFTFCMSSKCPTSPANRALNISKIIPAAATLSQVSGFKDMMGDIAFRLLHVRLEQGPIAEWDIVDSNLRDALKKPTLVRAANSNVSFLIDALRVETWGEAGNILRDAAFSYLRCCVPSLSGRLLTMMQDQLQSIVAVDELKLLRKEINLKTGDLLPEVDAGPNIWRDQVKTMLASIIQPEEITWMDDEESLTDPQYARRALADIADRFQSPLKDRSATSRIALANELLKFTTLLAHPNASKRFLSAYIGVFAQLLDGSAEEVTPMAYFRIFQAFGTAVKHDNGSSEFIEKATTLVFQSMKSPDRSTRVAAGRPLGDIIRIDPRQGEHIFSNLYNLMNSSKPKVQETTLITAGFIARTNNPEILGQSVCFLLAQLDQHNPVVQSTAYVQLQTAAGFHHMAPSALLKPHLEQIAPFLLNNICTRPELLRETCRLMSCKIADFIANTAGLTLPHLFGNASQKELVEVAGIVELSPSQLFFNYGAEILGHVYLTSGPGRTANGLSFIRQILEADSTPSASIPPSDFVRSHKVHLLARLVIETGHDDKDAADAGIAALHKVCKTLSADSLGSLLHDCVLGLTTSMVEMLSLKNTVEHKCKILSSIGALIDQVGPPISSVAIQFMATFQNHVAVPEFAESTLSSWYTFLRVLPPNEVEQHIGPTSACIVSSWPIFSPGAKKLAAKCIDRIVFELGDKLDNRLDDVIDLSTVPDADLAPASRKLIALRSRVPVREQMIKVLGRCSSHNISVALQSMGELKRFMLIQQEFIQQITSGDMFDPLASQTLSVLISAACREADDAKSLRLIAFECIGIFGAIDPDRCELVSSDVRILILKNFEDEDESAQFVLHLISDLLAVEFRSTSDISYQLHLAYCIQGLMQFCKFTPTLVTSTAEPSRSNKSSSKSLKSQVRRRWTSLPAHVLNIVTPLLNGTFTRGTALRPDIVLPIYPTVATYRQWIQQWSTHLIGKVSEVNPSRIFQVFQEIVRFKDAGIGYHLLPHLVLHILLSGSDDDASAISQEFLIVLQDQVAQASTSSHDKQLLSAQAVFILLDHLEKWARSTRLRTMDRKRHRLDVKTSEQLLRVDSVLSSINFKLMADAAFQCKSYARSLKNLERHIKWLQEHPNSASSISQCYERLHEIYACLDEPDGMEGTSTLILSPSLEHQIRQHESTGHWTSAQSCWEVRLQQAPDNLDFHLGLLRCLRNLGHYDTLRTHVRGVLIRNPNWAHDLCGFEIEGAWMVDAWDEVQKLVDSSESETRQISMAKLLLAIRSGETNSLTDCFSLARSALGTPIIAAGSSGYRRAYEAVLDLHLIHELEIVNTAIPASSKAVNDQTMLNALISSLESRLNSTLPNFRTREYVLGMRRTAFSLSHAPREIIRKEIGQSWLVSAKFARISGQWQTAYSAVLQAQQHNMPFSFIESAKLVKAIGEPLRALIELENPMRLRGLFEPNPTVDSTITGPMKAKMHLLRSRWMNETGRYEVNAMFTTFQAAVNAVPSWESSNYYLGQFYDQTYKDLPAPEKASRGMRMNLYTILHFAKAVKFGSKFVYQAIPRMLTLWLHLGEDHKIASSDFFQKINNAMEKAIKETPVYKWFTAFPQIVSRVGYDNLDVYKLLSKLILIVLQEFPMQGLWLFTSVVKSTKSNRRSRGEDILNQLKSNPKNASTNVPLLIRTSLNMINELLALCDQQLDKNKKELSMVKHFPNLHALGHSCLIIPLQESLTANLPATSSATNSTHHPFPLNAPTFAGFDDVIEVMHSLARPRKIMIRGSNGQTYNFLGKPKDDLRKDARLMDFNSIVNKLLKKKSESRRRQLHIRTYGVVTLNEECGFIQWVDNTIPIRPVLYKLYNNLGIPSWNPEITEKIKNSASDKDTRMLFKEVLEKYPPVFHLWLLETFPEPNAWLTGRLTYGRSLAVMSMVGFILGLGDRHLENMLLDCHTGDVVHVDFNCLFEKGKTFDTPERVPFRLTQNIVDALGVTGVEGVFRNACEVTLQLLRENKDSLMNVLDAFVHDPLVEWEDEKRRIESGRNRNNVKVSPESLRKLAENALHPIGKKLDGIYTPTPATGIVPSKREKEITSSHLVQVLIEEATDDLNLARMYIGWASWH